MADSFLVELVAPDGTITDVSSLVDLESFGAVSLGVEDGLLQFRTGDMTLGFHNPLTVSPEPGVQGDFFSDLFSGADPSGTWILRVTRTGNVTVKFFEGVLFLPASVRFNRAERVCELTALGYMKLLEGQTAEVVARTFPTTTASGTAGGLVLTLSPSAAGILQGDRLRVSSAVDSEEVVVNSVGATTVTLKAALGKTWAAGSPVEFLTTFYRRKTPAFLIGELFKAAGILSPVLDVATGFTIPVATPIMTDGLNSTDIILAGSLIQKGSVMHLEDPFPAGLSKEAPDVVGGTPWTAATRLGSNDTINGPDQALVDWRRYRTTEPGTHVLNSWEYEKTSAIETRGGRGVDYSSSPVRHYYCDLGTNTVPAPDVHTWAIKYESWDAGNHLFSTPVVTVGTLQTLSSNSAQTGCFISAELDTTRNLAWYAYGVNDAADGGSFGYWDLAGGTNRVLEKASVGSATASMGDVIYDVTADVLVRLKQDGVTLQGWKGDVKQFEVTIGTGLILRTLNYINGLWVGISIRNGRTILVVADLQWVNVTELVYSNSVVVDSGVWFDKANWLAHFGNLLVGKIAQTIVAVGKVFEGVIVEADFTGQSVAGALTNLAQLVNAVVYVDNDFQGYFLGRDSTVFQPDEGPKILDSLVVSDESDLVWENYFPAVKATSADGVISVTTGNVNAEGRALEVDVPFAPNLSVVGGVALGYAQFYGKARRERRVEVDDDETVYAPMQVVSLDAALWLVYEVNHNLADRIVALRLLEIL